MKIKNYLLGAGILMAGTAMTASAAVPDAKSFPGASPQANRTERASTPMRAPLNPEKGLGTKIFGYTTFDRQGILNYVNLYSNTPSRLNRLNDVLIAGCNYDEVVPRNVHVNAGTWAGDGYYAYRMFYYTFESRLIDWVKVDPETGSAYQAHVWADGSGGPDPAWWSPVQDLAWNPNTNELFAIAQNTDGTITSVLQKVDKTTGQYTSAVKVLPEYYFAAAFDYDNNLYAVTWKYNSEGARLGTYLDVFDSTDNYNRVSRTEIKVDGKDWLIYYDNNLTFDYTTGDLWWNAVQTADGNSEEVRLVRINPRTMATENFGSIGASESIGGMYIDYVTAESRTAPAQVKDADFTIDPAGDAKVTLEWTNPTTYWNLRNMSNLSSVEIYRDAYPGTVAGTVTATGKEGQKMTWTDTGASNGVHTYYIVPVNANGKGVPYKLDAFVGKDVPGPVQNVAVNTADSRTIHIEWTKPVRGDNDGWFDDSDLSYTLVRMPDNVTVGTTKDMNYTDNSINEADRYYYLIYASNAQGKGSAAQSESVLAGTGLKAPFYTDLSTREDADRFTCIDKNGDYKTFEYGNNNHLARNSIIHLLSDYDNDDIFVTPTLKVEKGKTYKLTYDIYFSSVNIPGTRTLKTPFRLVGGTEPTAEGMTDILFEDLDRETVIPMQTEKYSVYFTAPVNGDYYVGLETLISQEQLSWIYIEGVKYENAPDDDLEASSVKSHLYLSTIGSNRFDVNVYNNGKNDQSAYTVKLAVLGRDNQPRVFAETSDVPTVKSHETQTVTMYAKMPALGEQALVALVELKGDGNSDNDMSEPSLVQCDETAPLNHTVTDAENQNKVTNIPFNHFYACTASQTIYTPEMTGLEFFDFGDDNPVITRIAWEGVSLKDNLAAFEDTQLTVYMSQTEKRGYEEGESMIPVTSKPLFDDIVPLKGGRNYVVADFDTEFTFDPSESLVVTVLKEDHMHGDWLFDWHTFDPDWDATYYHSMVYTGSAPMDPAYPSGNIGRFADAPVIHLAVNGIGSGVGQIVFTKNHVAYYNRTNSTVQTSDVAIATVEVYNTNGQLIDRVKGDGTTSVKISADKGVALIKITGVDGTVISFKTII